MKMCQKHWEMLRQQVKDHGLWAFVATSGEDAANRMKQQMAGVETLETFEPLLRAHNMIMTKGLEMGGAYMLSGDYCPVCECMRAMAGAPDEETGIPVTADFIEQHWVKGPVEAVMQYALEQGYIAATSKLN